MQAEILAAQDIAFADPSLVIGQQVTPRTIIDMDKIKPRVDIGGHPPARRLDHEQTGRCRLDVARPERGRRVDDHHRRGFLGYQPANRFFGEIFRALVMADHVGEADWRIFVGRARVRRQAKRRDAARIDDSEGAGLGSGPDEVATALDVGRVHSLGIGHPETVVGGNVKDCLATRDSTVKRRRIGQVSFDDFEIESLEVQANEGQKILHGINLTINRGEVHAIMGPNGSGKSTLATTLMGSPEYEVVGGCLRFRGDDITEWGADARAKAGMFLAFQYPQEISGVSVRNFLRQAASARKGEDISAIDIYVTMQDWMERLDMDASFMDRYLNEGFSGGEKKRNEILQLAILEPDFAVLDETDSGLDVDALKIVAQGVREVRQSHPEMGILLITHYQRLLTELQPDYVHILVNGRIVESGGPELAEQLEREGYERFDR